jgi:hypothetical protein
MLQQRPPTANAVFLPVSGLRFLAHAVVHASALTVFLSFALTMNGVQFFYYYPRPAQTVLPPFILNEIVWLATAVFAVIGLGAIGIVYRGTQDYRKRWRSPEVLLGFSIAAVTLGFLVMGHPIPFWWLGTSALAICWLTFGISISRTLGEKRALLELFLASLLGIAAILEIWSLSHWLYSGLGPRTIFGKVGADLEMNLAYSNAWAYPPVFIIAWLSPALAFLPVLYFRWRANHKPVSTGQRDHILDGALKLEMDDVIVGVALTLLSLVVAFYAYFHNPPWLVGTDAYWRYRDPLERLMSSPNALTAAANERHSFYLLIAYAVHLVSGGSAFDIVKLSPVALSAALGLLSYYLVVRFRGNRSEGFFAGFFSITTFPTTLGVFASIHANWLGLIFILLVLLALASVAFFPQSWKHAALKVVIAVLVGNLLLILHPWTWGILAASLLLAGLVFLAKKRWSTLGASWSIPILGLLTGLLAFSLASEAQRATLLQAIRNFSAPLRNLAVVLSPYDPLTEAFGTWAPFLNPFLMILAGAGVIRLLRSNGSPFSTLLLSWALVSGAGTFAAVALRTEIWRIWFVQPLWLLAGIGVGGVLRIRGPQSNWKFPDPATALAGVVLVAVGVAVSFLQPMIGSGIFYLSTLAPLMISLTRNRSRADSVFANALTVFIAVFFLNHALRSLQPLIIDPHNFRELP